MITARTLTDGGQQALDVANEIATFVAAAQRSLDIALYDVKLHATTAAPLLPLLVAKEGAGVPVRIVFNRDYQGGPPVPPPPQGDWQRIDALEVPTRGVPGVPDLMHHKYVVRDGSAVLTGSANWTDDSWTREENVIVTVESEEVAAHYTQDFEQLWKRDVQHSGRVEPGPVLVDGKRVWTWFTPHYGEQLSHRISSRLGKAQRIRIASPVISSGPILGTLAQIVSDGGRDVAGVVDATQINEVLYQWARNGNASWKSPSLRCILERGDFTGKRSTPYAPGSVHDYMHAKVTVADDTVFVGSFNLSHSGEMNAENVLEIEDPQLADQLAAFIDTVRAKYGRVQLQEEAGSTIQG